MNPLREEVFFWSEKAKGMKRSTLDTNIITAFLKKGLRVVNRVSDFRLIDGGHNE